MQYYSPAGKNLAGGHRETVLQGGHTVLESENRALKTWIREKLHLRHAQQGNKPESSTLSASRFSSDNNGDNNARLDLLFFPTFLNAYLKLGCVLKIILKAKEKDWESQKSGTDRKGEM